MGQVGGCRDGEQQRDDGGYVGARKRAGRQSDRPSRERGLRTCSPMTATKPKSTMAKKKPATKPTSIPLTIGQTVEWVEWSDNRTVSDWNIYDYWDEQKYRIKICKGVLVSFDANYAVVEVSGWFTSSLQTILRANLHTSTTGLRAAIRAFLGNSIRATS